MKIIWFSEIKWSYLRTRKQHILANFDDSDEILFKELSIISLFAEKEAMEVILFKRL